MTSHLDQVLATAFLISLAITLVITAVLTVAQMLLFPAQSRQQQQQTSTPKSADGKYNFKQNVPSLTRALGRVKKAGDYFFLEERNGQALHGIMVASHRIQGYVQHYLHDEAITVSGGSSGSVTAPAHFLDSDAGFPYIAMDSRLGLPLETAYSGLVSDFGDIWTEDHRGDGLATVLLNFGSAPAEKYSDVYPQQSPEHTCVVDGALVFDPRGNQDPYDPETWAFSANLAILRLDHLTHVSGGKISKADMHLPEWSAAADVADEVVLNRLGEEEPRYHGGIWYRYSSDQVEIGRLLDEAGEMVVYERADGKIGVHPGVLVPPDIRITADDILVLRYDANRRLTTNVLAVRGRFTDPDQVYNTVDAAIFGNPYTGDDTQRTKTIENQVVQWHNHMQRLQKLSFIRANAPRVSLTIPFNATGPTRKIRERRFVRVHRPERGLDEAIVEIIGRPKLSLRNLTYTFDGIVVPETLCDFDAVTEEGARNGAEQLAGSGVPMPDNFAIGINTEVVSAGQSQAFGVASWDFVSASLTYELEYQLADESAPPASVSSKPGETEVRTPYLADGAAYRFRLRTKSNGANSEWTGYENETAVADSVAPDQPTDFDSSAAGSDVTLTWTNPNSTNLYRTELYRGTTGTFGAATLIYTSNGGIGAARSYEDAGLSAGTYYWWLVSKNASGVGSSPVGPETQTI